MRVITVRLLHAKKRAIVAFTPSVGYCHLDDCDLKLLDVDYKSCDLFTAHEAAKQFALKWQGRPMRIRWDSVTQDGSWYVFPVDL